MLRHGLRIGEDLISCSEIDTCRWFLESNWNSKQKDWLVMATFQEGTVNFAVFCAIPALVVFSWIVYLFDSRYVGSFNFSSANIQFLDTSQTVPSQVSKVYGVLSQTYETDIEIVLVFFVCFYFSYGMKPSLKQRSSTHMEFSQNMLGAQNCND